MLKSFRFAAVSVAVLCLGFSATEAQAQYSCSDATYGSGSGTYNSTYSSCSTNNTANQASTVATSAAVLKAATTQASKLVTGRISSALNGAGGFNLASNGFSASTGMAAGNGGSNVGVWVSGSWTAVEDDNTDTAFEGDVYSIMVGMDVKATADTVLGVALGYENTDIDTQYNGTATTDGNLDGDGYTIAPYIGVKLGPNAHADLMVGYSNIDYDTLRYDPNTGNSITGSTDADRYFVNASVGGSHNFAGSNWRLRGKTGVFYASEEKDAFTETESTGATIAAVSEDNDFGQITVDAKLGYAYEQVEPYVLVGVEFDFSKDEGPVAAGQTSSMDDDFGAKFGGGLDLRLGPNVTGGIEAYTVEFRDDYNEYTVTGGLRVNF